MNEKIPMNHAVKHESVCNINRVMENVRNNFLKKLMATSICQKKGNIAYSIYKKMEETTQKLHINFYIFK